MRYRFIRDVEPADWSALPRAFAAGEVVNHFQGHTYGLDCDDALAGHETVPCTVDGERFFTVPVDLLVDDDDKRPAGAYTAP